MIKIREGYFLRNVLDVYVVMSSSKETYAPNCIMSVNKTGEILWRELESGADVAQLVEKLTERFEVSAADAEKDVELFLTQLREKNLVIEC